jgi:hypothetical protein
MKNSETHSRLSLYNYPAVILGLFIFFVALLFFFKEKFIVGIIVFFISNLLLTYKKVITIDTEEYSVMVHREVLSISNTSRTVFLKPRDGKVVLVNSINEVNGLDQKSNTFFNYDVLYRLKNNHTINIYASTNEAHAGKIAIFISRCLNLELEHETNDRRL